MFSVPVNNPSTSLIAWYQVNLNRLLPVVEVFYGRFDSESHFAESNEPRKVVTVVSIRGATAQLLCTTSLHRLTDVLQGLVGQALTQEGLDSAVGEARQNQLYDDVRSLIRRILTGTATEQELEDCEGWQVLAEAVLVPGVSHLDPDPFPLEPVEGGEE